jgi:hypothetical protein
MAIKYINWFVKYSIRRPSKIYQTLDLGIQTLIPESFEAVMKLREETYSSAPYCPSGDVESLFADTWYLDNVDDRHRRFYKVLIHCYRMVL